jgi:hypothetical protein
MEAVNLISSSKYSEKQIVCALFFTRLWAFMDLGNVGVPCSDSTDARELRFPSTSCQLYSKGFGRKQRGRQLSCASCDCQRRRKRDGRGVIRGCASTVNITVSATSTDTSVDLIEPQNLQEFRQKEGRINSASTLPQASRCHSCCRMGAADCIHNG